MGNLCNNSITERKNSPSRPLRAHFPRWAILPTMPTLAWTTQCVRTMPRTVTTIAHAIDEKKIDKYKGCGRMIMQILSIASYNEKTIGV